MQVVLASRNVGKLKELADLLAPLGLMLTSQAEFDIPSADETGLTFLENALIKARSVAAATTLPSIADDSGLVVPALNGAPGIYSARYAGAEATDADNNAKLVTALQSQTDRRAYFYCALVYLRYADDPTPLVATAAWHGEIIDEPRGQGGFGYDPHFWVSETGCTSAELAKQRKNAISHRGQAMSSMLDLIRQDLNQ
jgi:XTP/dITP diphosphohydrolase